MLLLERDVTHTVIQSEYHVQSTKPTHRPAHAATHALRMDFRKVKEAI